MTRSGHRVDLTYGAYLHLDELLSAQDPVSRPVHHDERARAQPAELSAAPTDAKRGTGGTGGVAFLRPVLEITFFPELSAVRTEIGT